MTPIRHLVADSEGATVAAPLGVDPDCVESDAAEKLRGGDLTGSFPSELSWVVFPVDRS